MSQDSPTVQELFDLSGRVAIVTGGASGIGLQMATALAEAGASLVLASRSLERCEGAASTLREQGAEAIGLECHVAEEGDVERLVARTVERFGRIDILLNNAGTSWGAAAESHPLDGWQKVIDVNLTGTFLCSREAGKVMLEQGSGKIVNVASVAALRGAPPEVRTAGAYSASKGGMVALTLDLAGEWGGRGINVNAIAPGWFPTAISEYVIDRQEERIVQGVPLGRLGGPHDLKGAALFLCSRASDYVTGQVLVVDGGKTIW